MSTQFGISQSDLTPSPIPSLDYATLTADIASIADVIGTCEETFVSWLGGMPTETANIALCKPQVVYVVVWYLHYLLSQNPDYEIPKSVQAMFDAARTWATGTGQKLLAAEGDIALPGQASVSYDAPAARFTRRQMDLL
jgi:hypothetical protein